MTWLARAKTIGATCLLALVVGALVARACTWVLGSMDHPKFILTSATGFTITSSIYSTSRTIWLLRDHPGPRSTRG